MTTLAKPERNALANREQAQALDRAMDEAVSTAVSVWQRIITINAEVESTQAWRLLGYGGIQAWRDAKLTKHKCRSRVMQIIADGRELEKRRPLKAYEGIPEGNMKEIARFLKQDGKVDDYDALLERAKTEPEEQFKPYMRALAVTKLDTKTEWRSLTRTMQRVPYEAWERAEAMIRRVRELNPDAKDFSEVYETAAEVLVCVGEARIRELLESGQIAGLTGAEG